MKETLQQEYDRLTQEYNDLENGDTPQQRKNLLCWIGVHRWREWPVAPFSNVLGDRTLLGYRECLRCGCMQSNRVYQGWSNVQDKRDAAHACATREAYREEVMEHSLDQYLVKRWV